ncbi:uncharacterized protein LOC125370199 [Ricinus communis]|uniref:uncharacterized protein LOC125370199 n=1 Tax=Ricinus communis TaxID=3988 RepID=UPI00201AAC35|nr:uncharacterized protein LOC125370199 [Ricinus communis]
MPVQAVQPRCEFCGGPHYSANCNAGGMFASSMPTNVSNVEHVDYVGRQQNDPYSNTYNPGWRNHPNFGWRNSNNQGPLEYQRLHQQQPMQFIPHQPGGSQEKKPNLEELMMKFIATSENDFKERCLRNQQASIQNLETQIGQLSRMMAKRQPCTLPSNTESNPREHAKAITLRSGKKLTSSSKPFANNDSNVQVDESKKKDKPEEKEKGAVEEKEDSKKIPLRPYQPPIPYPAKLKQDKVDQQFALADLGASINLMPSSLFEELGLSTSKLTPTRMSIQLVDRTVKYPKGIIEDVLVKVNKFIFPVDFVVMDMNGESDVPLILGRPFLATSKALIYVSSGKLELKVDDESITFDLTKSLRYPYEHDGASFD